MANAKSTGQLLVIPTDVIRSVEDDIRDIVNWVAVFEKEYDLNKEVVKTLKGKLEGISRKLVGSAK
ncbi:MAG TPA: hypothetical protein VJI46_03595 [Candidatus Nanoarchaeia archaeon]|nr:hypothetical protein [Candidatus Nanoarchaeia archaeon]